MNLKIYKGIIPILWNRDCTCFPYFEENTKERKAYKMSSTQTNISINRQHKDRLFTMIFGDNKNKKNILSLYNALHGTNYTNEDDVDITTIEDALYINMKNDVSILLDSYLSLWEHQSTFNPNMPIRGLIYYGNLYNSYIETKELPIYNSSLVKLPTPRYFVFYNGTTKREPIEKLKLSDAFIHEDTTHEFEWTATMINLNKGKNEELLSKCKPLSDYMTLINKINQYKIDATLHDAVERAINECIEENILADFLRKHRGDVMNTCLTEFSEELYKKGLLEEGRELGLEEGRELGLEEACIQNAKHFFENGATYELVRASIKQLSDDRLQEIYNEVMASKK